VIRAEQANVVGSRRATECERMAMLEREMAPLAAAPSVGVDESALPAVSFPHETRDVARHVP